MKFTLQYPIKPIIVTQHFGETANLAYYEAAGINFIGHNGIDFHAYHGQPIYAAHDGTAYYEIDQSGGHGVIIVTNDEYDYKGGQAYFKSIYWHMIDSSKEPQFKSPIEGYSFPGNGIQVKTGDLIGYANSTGLSTGDHLHFGLKPMLLAYPSDYTNIEQNNGYMGAIDPTPYFPRHIFNTDMNYGENSPEVSALQDYLIQNGFMTPIPSAQYGIYGPKTASGVFLFQKTYQVSNQLVLAWNRGKYVGPLTRKFLNSV